MMVCKGTMPRFSYFRLVNSYNLSRLKGMFLWYTHVETCRCIIHSTYKWPLSIHHCQALRTLCCLYLVYLMISYWSEFWLILVYILLYPLCYSLFFLVVSNILLGRFPETYLLLLKAECLQFSPCCLHFSCWISSFAPWIFPLSLLMYQFLLLNSSCLLDMLSNHPLLLQSFHLKSQDLLRDLRNAGGVAAGSAGVSAGTPRSSAELREAVEVAKS